MSKFIVSTCLFTFWAFYELSGGADFTPPARDAVVAEAPVAKPAVAKTEQPILVTQGVTTVQMPAVFQPTAVAVKAAYTVIPAPEAPAKIDDVTLVAETEMTKVDDLFGDMRIVSGDWVNMRNGPSTNDAVLDTLPRGTKAEVITLNGDGWAQIRLRDNGQVGWMAARLLSDG